MGAVALLQPSQKQSVLGVARSCNRCCTVMAEEADTPLWPLQVTE